MKDDIASVRAGEELNVDALARYLSGKVAGAESGITVTQFPKGHSNLTYLLKAGVREYVLRRAPLGPVAPKAHDMAREYRVLAAVHLHFPEAPRVLHLCEDASIIGAVFFLMERRHGLILRDTVPPELFCVPDYPRRISEAFIACLVRLHAIDLAETGLLSLGRPDGFLERQVQGWAERWRRAKTAETRQMDTVIRWLGVRLPESAKPTLVHNDFKLDNVMLPMDSVDRVQAVLDWEMTTVGDPLVDIGLTLCYWSLGEESVITSQAGWYTREQFLSRYAELSRRDLSRIGYYEVLGIFKLAVILQQIYYRFRVGQTVDCRFEVFGERVEALINTAARLAEQSDTVKR